MNKFFRCNPKTYSIIAAKIMYHNYSLIGYKIKALHPRNDELL